MRNVRLWRALLGVDCRTVIEDIEFDQEAVLQLLLRGIIGNFR